MADSHEPPTPDGTGGTGGESERSFAARLRAHYGSVADPGPSLESEPPTAPSLPSDELLQRLASHALRGTRYRFQHEVARGAMGAILKVWDEDLRRHLAMKVMLADGAAPPRADGAPPPDPKTARGTTAASTPLLARFLEEAQITGQLDHPGIVPVHEMGIDGDGRVFFTMRLVRGRDLRAIFELVHASSEGWNQTRALGALLQVCEAMAYAHAKGVIHRDLKPANVMVGSFGEVYVMDWGLARVIGRRDTHDLTLRPPPSVVLSSVKTDRHAEKDLTPDSPLVTMDGDVVGTPCYMAPEQARGELEQLGPHSDAYSIGSMLYHLLTRQMPYVAPGFRISNRTVLARLLDGPPKDVHTLAPEVPPELVAICEKAMAREIGERYADTRALAADLRAYLEHRVVRAYQTGAAAELRKWAERNRGLAAASLAALLLAFAGLAGISYVQAEGKRAAQAAEARAEANAELARAETAKVLRLSDAHRLAQYRREAEELWPALPDRVPALVDWLERAGRLAANLPVHRQALAELRARGRALGEAGGAQAFTFPEVEAQWQHDTLAELVQGLERFASDDAREGAIAAVRARLESAETIRARTIAEHRAAWDAAIAAIADAARSPQYAGLALAPQLGLIPLGPDPDSGLWEFAHLQSGVPAERGDDGRLVMTADTGIVLVLVPGGTFSMGAQAGDPTAPNFDAHALAIESPVHAVRLGPYFLSKFEMTQGQWSRATGSNPSAFQPEADALLHPIEQVNHAEAARAAFQLGLRLPTEAQWERAVRAGTESRWWTGDDERALEGYVNVADRHLKEHGGSAGRVYEDWMDDGATRHAAVGTYRANPFGLHDVHGSVWEWCSDWHGSYTLPVRAGDGERVVAEGRERIIRGGSWKRPLAEARSARRAPIAPSSRGDDLGLRPARAVDP